MAKTSTHVRKGDTVEVIAGAELYEYQKSSELSMYHVPMIRTGHQMSRGRESILSANPGQS